MADGPPIHRFSRRFSRRLATPIAGILLFAAAGYLWQHIPAPEGGAPPATSTAGPEQLYYGPRRSVAVLPFADGSADAGQDALAHGFAAELQGQLQALPDLQVTARSSSFFFQDGSVPLRIVAERVQAAYLLGGDWREEDRAVTVTATLYDAYRDRELWRADYTAELSSVRQLQYDIVRDALANLPGQPPAQPPAPSVGPDPNAWVLLQQGRHAADPLGPGDLAAAEAALRAALDLQPDYDAARLELAALWLHPAWPREADPAAVERARAAAQAVLGRPASAPLTTDGDRAQAWGLLSHLRHHHDWQWRAAAEAAQQGLEVRPGDAGLLALASLARFTLGDLEAAQTLLQASLDRDPLNLGSRLRLGLVQEFAGQYDAALASYRRLLSLRPDYPAAHAFRARVKVLQGKAESAVKESAQESEPFWRRYAEALALTAAERRDEAQTRIRAMIAEDASVAAFQLAELFAFAGDADEAFVWLGRARDQKDPGLSALLANPLLADLHADPRWAVLLERLGLPSEWPPEWLPELPLDWRE